MPRKSEKKHHSAKNFYQNQRTARTNQNLVGSQVSRDHINKRTSNPKQMRISGGKTALKPPQNGYLIWGRHAVLAALANPERRIQQVYVLAESYVELKRALNDIDQARTAEIPQAQIIDRARLDSIGDFGEKIVHQGIAAAVWPLDVPHLDTFLESIKDSIKIKKSKSLRLLLLDQISDPRNFGAIVRSARAFNVSGVITTFRNTANENGIMARAAAGALDHIPLIRVVNLARAIEKLQHNGFFVAGLAGDGKDDVSSLRLHENLALVLGAEGSGLRRLSRIHCDTLVRININSDAESLNVSNAAAVALYAASKD